MFQSLAHMQLLLKEHRLQCLQKLIPASECFHLTVLHQFDVALLQGGISNDTHKIKQLKSET